MQHFHFKALRDEKVISSAELLAPSTDAAIVQAADLHWQLQADGFEVWSGSLLLHRQQEPSAH